MKYESFARDHLPIVSVFGDEAMCRCVYHDDSNASLQFNLEKGLFICFACGARGSVKQLAQHIGAGPVDTSTTLTDVYAALQRAEHRGDAEKVLPESALDRYTIPTDYWEVDRNLSLSVIERFQLGCDVTNEYVTIPMRNVNGELLGVIKRFLDPEAVPRYKYPFGMKKSHHLFGAWAASRVRNGKTVVLTEGSIDAMKVWQAGYIGMGILGSEVSHEQARILQMLDVRRVVLFFDNDPAGMKCRSHALGYVERSDGNGGTVKRYDRRSDLRRSFAVESVRYGYGDPKDPGAMTSARIADLIESSTTYI